MDISALILKYFKKRKTIKVADIAKKTGFSRAYIHRFFKDLQKENKIVLVGRTNRAFYVSSGKNVSAVKAFRHFPTKFSGFGKKIPQNKN